VDGPVLLLAGRSTIPHLHKKGFSCLAQVHKLLYLFACRTLFELVEVDFLPDTLAPLTRLQERVLDFFIFIRPFPHVRPHPQVLRPPQIILRVLRAIALARPVVQRS
jgi:hypothetical protein